MFSRRSTTRRHAHRARPHWRTVSTQVCIQMAFVLLLFQMVFISITRLLLWLCIHLLLICHIYIYHAAGSYYTARKSWSQLSANKGAPGAYPLLTNTHLDHIQAGITSHKYINDPFHYSHLVSPPSQSHSVVNIYTRLAQYHKVVQ